MNTNSVLGKDWKSKNYNEETVNFLKNNFSLSEIISRLIAIRKINISEVNLFLNPRLKNILPNPFILKDMEKSAGVLSNEKIGIFGDYDVDGATSTALWEITLIKLIKKYLFIFQTESQRDMAQVNLVSIN